MCYECKKTLDSIDGVRSSDITVGSAVVVYDDTKTNKDGIALAVKNAGCQVSN